MLSSLVNLVLIACFLRIKEDLIQCCKYLSQPMVRDLHTKQIGFSVKTSPFIGRCFMTATSKDDVNNLAILLSNAQTVLFRCGSLEEVYHTH